MFRSAPRTWHNIIEQTAYLSHIGTTNRALSTTTRRMVKAEDVTASEGEDANDLARQTTSLVDEGRWSLCNNGKGLERQFKFKTFKTTWDFMTHVAAECKKTRHHPEWTNVYNKTHIRWTTHSPEGLSNKDTSMARFCDQAGEEFGELPPEEGAKQTNSSGVRVESGDCCGGKKAQAL